MFTSQSKQLEGEFIERFFHSVTLDKDKCKGCINCIKRCPTEAIRVRNGKAKIITEKCIDCGECIRVCPHHAKKAVFDTLEILNNFKYNIALPAPALYGQFHNLDDVDIILNGLVALGFDSVYEVSKAAEIISDATRKMLPTLKKPVISSACPAVTRLIRVRFPELIENVLPLNAPIELAARMAKEQAMKQTGFSADEIGVIFISPCPAKVTAIKMPLGLDKSAVSGAVAISDIYPKLVSFMNELQDSPLIAYANSGKIGVGWGSSGGEAAAILSDNHLAADGIENVIKVLENIEDEKLGDVEFIELNACSAGCVGGVLTIENPYIAKARLKRLRRYLPVSFNHLENEKDKEKIMWNTPLIYTPVYKLDENVDTAIAKMKQIDILAASLPGLDCGSCGSPSCRALAEDVIQGKAKEDDCVYLLKEYMQNLASQINNLGGLIPPTYRNKK